MGTKKKDRIKIAVVMPSKIRPENMYSTLMSKVSSYVQAVEEDEDASYHLRYLKSLKRQIEGKMEEGEISSELQAIHDLLETFLPYYLNRDGE